MQSILSMFDIPVKFIEKPCVQKPYWIVELPDEVCARKIASRSVLLKNCIELWSRAKTIPQLHYNLTKSVKNTSGNWIVSDGIENSETSDHHICPCALIESCLTADYSFKVDVETFCKHFTTKEKVDKIEVNIKINLQKLNYEEFYFLMVVVWLIEVEDTYIQQWANCLDIDIGPKINLL